jgi:hypothetical protein
MINITRVYTRSPQKARLLMKRIVAPKENQLDSLKIAKSSSTRLVLDRSRLGSWIMGSFTVGFTLVWYYIILKDYLPEHSVLESIRLKVEADKTSLLFLFAGVFLFKEIYTSFRNALYGERFELFKNDGTVFRNGKPYFRFTEVSKIQIREFSDSEGDITYRLSIILNDGSKKFIESSSSQNKIHAIADDLADILDVKIVSKS